MRVAVALLVLVAVCITARAELSLIELEGVCGGIDSCGSCSANSHCGWCATEQRCTPASASSCQISGCVEQHFYHEAELNSNGPDKVVVEAESVDCLVPKWKQSKECRSASESSHHSTSSSSPLISNDHHSNSIGLGANPFASEHGLPTLKVSLSLSGAGSHHDLSKSLAEHSQSLSDILHVMHGSESTHPAAHSDHLHHELVTQSQQVLQKALDTLHHSESSAGSHHGSHSESSHHSSHSSHSDLHDVVAAIERRLARLEKKVFGDHHHSESSHAHSHSHSHHSSALHPVLDALNSHHGTDNQHVGTLIISSKL